MLYLVYFSCELKKKSFAGNIYIDSENKKDAEDTVAKFFKVKKVRATLKVKKYNIAERMEGI